MTIRSRLSFIMAMIGLERLQLFALELGKLLYLIVYTLASTITHQSAPNLVKRYRAIRSRVSSIMDVIRPEELELFVLKFEKMLYSTLFTLCSIYKCQPINSKVGQNIYDSKISYEFD